jgi:hypothetical protein
MKYFTRCWSWLLLAGLGSGCTEQAPTSGAQQKPATKAPLLLNKKSPAQNAARQKPATMAPAHRPALPAQQDVRVNDTLVLECRRPYTTLTQYEKPPLTMWLHMALRGRRGYYEVLSQPDDTLSLYCLHQCLDEALVSARGGVLHFSVLEPGRLPGDDAQRGQPLPDKAVYAFDRWVWDVRYRQYTGYLTADLKDLDRGTAACFTGGSADEEYRLLPYWISREQAYLKRRHHLPPARRLLAYSNFSREATDPSYIRGYGRLLLILLRAWQAYPMPTATAHHLSSSIQHLKVELRKASSTERPEVARH